MTDAFPGKFDMLTLTPSERRIVAALVAASPAVVAFKFKHTTKVMVHRIRQKLGPEGKSLVTVWGKGYRWIG